MARAKRRNMSAKQIRFFGTKRQRAALKAKRRHAPAAKRRKATARKAANPARRRRRVTSSPPRKVRRRNPAGEIISFVLGNPAKRRKAVAKQRRRKATARRSNPAGRRRRVSATPRRRRAVRVTKRRSGHRPRSNPGALGSPMDWLQGGAGVLAGGVGARLLPQMLLGASNTGAIGYAGNAFAALGIGWLIHMLFPRNRVLSVAAIAGGFAALLQRVISDQTTYGSYLSMSGMGDYMVSSFATPQRLVDGLHTAQIAGPPPVTVIASSGAGAMNTTPGMGAYGPSLW